MPAPGAPELFRPLEGLHFPHRRSRMARGTGGTPRALGTVPGGVGAGLVPALMAKKQGTHKGCPYNDPETVPGGVV